MHEHYEIINHVDRLISDTGEYSPLRLLVTSGWGVLEGWQLWNAGDIETLDSYFTLDTSTLRQNLDFAQKHANQLNFFAINRDRGSQDQNSAADKPASCNRAINELLLSRFQREKNARQLDLFIDNSVQRSLHWKLVECLIEGEADSARAVLAKLAEVDMKFSHRYEAESLILAVEASPPQGKDHALENLRQMERQWEPSAKVLMTLQTDRLDRFIRPLWREIATALENEPFDPSDPSSHASRAYFECREWEKVESSVLSVPDYRKHWDLLTRMGTAKWMLGKHIDARKSWTEICFCAPEHFPKVVGSPDFLDKALQSVWFDTQLADVENVITPQWFPACLLIANPSMSTVFERRDDCDDPSRAFNMIKDLLHLPKGSDQSIGLRRRVQAMHEGLLQYYMQKQST